jgi:hypothetical protein
VQDDRELEALRDRQLGVEHCVISLESLMLTLAVIDGAVSPQVIGARQRVG